MDVHRRHAVLDTALAAALVTIVSLFLPGGVFALLGAGIDWLRAFPNHYEPVFDFIREPMSPVLAVAVWIVDIYFLLKTYVVEDKAVAQAHKKYAAHGTKVAAAIHGMGSVLELTVGLLAVLSLAKPPAVLEGGRLSAQSGLLSRAIAVLAPYQTALCRLTAGLALAVNVPSGLVLNPGVFGVKHLTIPGFAKFAVLRSMEALRVLVVDLRLLPNLWILLHVGTVVRLLGYFVLPYTSVVRRVATAAGVKATDTEIGDVVGRRGDLFTEPTIYSFNILLSGYLTAAFVYPPKFLLGSLALYACSQLVWPPRVSSRHGASAEKTE